MSSRSIDVAVASRSNLNRIGILDWDVTMGCWSLAGSLFCECGVFLFICVWLEHNHPHREENCNNGEQELPSRCCLANLPRQ